MSLVVNVVMRAVHADSKHRQNGESSDRTVSGFPQGIGLCLQGSRGNGALDEETGRHCHTGVQGAGERVSIDRYRCSLM